MVGPCRWLADAGRIELVRRRSFGFLHSAAEAVQQARYQFGTGPKPCPRQLEMVTTDPNSLLINAAPARGDVVLLEISTRRVFREGDLIAQANIRNKMCPEFGSLHIKMMKKFCQILSRYPKLSLPQNYYW